MRLIRNLIIQSPTFQYCEKCWNDLYPSSLWRTFKDNNLLQDRQSAYTADHLTETAVLRVLSDILLALDSSNIAVLPLQGLDRFVIAWFASYLNNRTQHVRLSATRSTELAVLYGVPQGSVLGPILFLLHTSDTCLGGSLG